MSGAIDQIVLLARKEIGYKEGANNSNKYGEWFKLNNQPWCAIFCCWILDKAGLANRVKRTASCIDMEKWGKEKGLIVNPILTKKGDLVLFDFHKAGKPEHIGIAIEDYNPKTKTIKTIEGNTGVASRTNGDGVYERVRSSAFVRSVIHPKY